ncbi:MAG: hypothetical protein IRZ07_01000 [Microbispora sp.]|nr:hypothetical protein [Microbispora sp.]
MEPGSRRWVEVTPSESARPYDRLAVLERLADQATSRPAARWLLLPVEQDGRPHIDNRPAPGALGAVVLPSGWLAEQRKQAAS